MNEDLAHKLAELERKIEGHDASIHNLFDAMHEDISSFKCGRYAIPIFHGLR